MMKQKRLLFDARRLMALFVVIVFSLGVSSMEHARAQECTSQWTIDTCNMACETAFWTCDAGCVGCDVGCDVAFGTCDVGCDMCGVGEDLCKIGCSGVEGLCGFTCDAGEGFCYVGCGTVFAGCVASISVRCWPWDYVDCFTGSCAFVHMINC